MPALCAGCVCGMEIMFAEEVWVLQSWRAHSGQLYMKGTHNNHYDGARKQAGDHQVHCIELHQAETQHQAVDLNL